MTSVTTSRQRYSRSIAAGVGGAISRASGTVLSLVSVPLLIRELGQARYGVFATVISFVSILAFADFGLGNGLVTKVAGSAELDDRPETVRLISSGMLLIGIVASLVAILGLVTAWMLPWSDILNAPETIGSNEASAVITIVVLAYALTLPLALVQKVQLAFQEGFHNALWQALGNGLALCGIAVGVLTNRGLPFFVFAWLAGQLGSLVSQATWYFGHRRPWLRPLWSQASVRHARVLIQLGASFFMLQLAVTLAFTSDYIVIARVLDSVAVAQYAVHAQPFAWIAGLAGVFLVPLWPAYSAALAAHDTSWAVTAFKRALVVVVTVSGALCALLILFGDHILEVWVGDAVDVDGGLLAALGLFTVATSLGGALSMLLNAGSIMRFQVFTSALMAIAALTLKVLGAREYGPIGLVMGTTIAYLVFGLIPTAWFVRRWISRGMPVGSHSSIA